MLSCTERPSAPPSEEERLMEKRHRLIVLLRSVDARLRVARERQQREQQRP